MSEVQKIKLPSPLEIRAYLDEYVIGQEEAKKVLSVATYNHYKRINYIAEQEANPIQGAIELKKSNILMVGPTGSGKTFITSTLAKFLDVPFAMADATAINSAKDIEGILINLIQNADFDIKKAERGIVYVDEIDKLSKKYRAVGEVIQQAFLKTLEGTVATIPLQGRSIQIDTLNILFICGGAFVGLDAIVRQRIGGSIAGLLEITELIKDVNPGDLAKFGLIPEFIGRLPIIVGLNELDKNALIDILTKPKNALAEQYKKMLAMEGIELVFDQNSLEQIAAKAISLKTGARGLRTIVEDRMLEIMYTAPAEQNLRKVTITNDVISKTGKATFEYTYAKPETELAETPVNPARNKSGFADL